MCVELVDLEETSGSSLSTSESDTSPMGRGGCHRWYSCCCYYLLGTLEREATCHSSLDSDDVLQHKVKAVENPLVPLSIVSCPITRCGLRQFTNQVFKTGVSICSSFDVHNLFFILMSLYVFNFLLKRHSFTFSHLMTLFSSPGQE